MALSYPRRSPRISLLALFAASLFVAGSHGHEGDFSRAKCTVTVEPPHSVAYYPERLEWQHRDPADVGMDTMRLYEAVQFAAQHENPGPRDLMRYV